MASYFLSDLHLGAAYLEDQHRVQREVCRFLDSIKGDAERIFLVGDILDYWFEYKYAVPRGFTRFFGKIAELADSGIEITWLIGNHDIWIFDYLPQELGIRVVDGVEECVIDGKRFFITHGDGVGNWGKGFRFIRKIFRNKVCQKLYSGLHPRWTIPFALGWSNSSRSSHEEKCLAEERLRNPESSNKVLIDFASEYASSHPDIDYFVFGHTHTPLLRRLSPTCEMAVLGDWLTQKSYARFAEGNLQLCSF